MGKYECDQPGHGAINWLDFKNEQMEWTEFLHAGANSGNSKVISIFFGWARSKMGVFFFFLIGIRMAIYFIRSWNLLYLKSEFTGGVVFYMLTVMHYVLVRATLYFVPLTFKCHSTAVVLVRPLVLSGRVIISCVFSSILLPFLSVQTCFLELDFDMMLETLWSCVWARFFRKLFLPSKSEKSAKNMVFELKEREIWSLKLKQQI